MHIEHVTIEVPLGHIDRAAWWYENKLGLSRIENTTPVGQLGDDSVWFDCGIRLLPVKHWESHHGSKAHLCICVGKFFNAIRDVTTGDSQEDVNPDMFFIKDAWSNRIEITR